MTFEEWWKGYTGSDKDKSLVMGKVYAQSAWDYQQARIEALEARLKAYELYYGVMTDAAIQYALNSGRGNNPTEKEWLAASVHAEIVKLEARIEVLKEALLEAAGEINDWGQYADEYFMKKHDLAGTVKRLEDLAEQEGE